MNLRVERRALLGKEGLPPTGPSDARRSDSGAVCRSSWNQKLSMNRDCSLLNVPPASRRRFHSSCLERSILSSSFLEVTRVICRRDAGSTLGSL